MIYKLISSETTEKDVEKAIQWYIHINKGLAKKFISELRLAIKHIQKNPEAIEIKYNSVRIIFLKKFPYGIHYKIEQNIVYLIAVFHTSENSEKWVNR